MCSCGNDDRHVVGKRITGDGKRILLWSDGIVTTRLGLAPCGIGVPRWRHIRAQAVAANWLIDFGLYDWHELPVVIREHRTALRRHCDRDTALLIARKNITARVTK